MYAHFFGLTQAPFSIAPDPRYLFMSERHREALAHLLYGLQGGGGFVLLSGEIGAGKTTVCRCFVEQLPAHCNVAYIFNPKLTVTELLQSICDEFHMALPAPVPAPGAQAGTQANPATVKDYLDPLNAYLLRSHALGQTNLLVIDEAQALSADVLEQLRLLTNLETNERKLLQIVLIGQPELRRLLARPELEQLAQRVIARFHLDALSALETAQYIAHRLAVAGHSGASPFDARALRRIYQCSRGVPRRINLLCDRALLGAYASGRAVVDHTIVERASAEVFGGKADRRVETIGTERAALRDPRDPRVLRSAVLGGVTVLGTLLFGVGVYGLVDPFPNAAREAARAATAPGGPTAAAATPAAARAPSRSTAASTPASATAGAGAGAAATATATAATAAATENATAASTGDSRSELPNGPPATREQTLRAAFRDEASAWRELGRSWKLDPGDPGDLVAAGADACPSMLRQQVACLRIPNSTLALVRQLGRPGLVTLRGELDRSTGTGTGTGVLRSYALLTGLTEQRVTLRLNGAAVTLPLALFATLWQGDFATLWRTPAHYVAPLGPGASGALVDRLGEQLSSFDTDAAPPPGQAFDAALKARVHAFQLAQGLRPDGWAGPTTFMQLNRVNGVTEPRLLAPVSLAAPSLPTQP